VIEELQKRGFTEEQIAAATRTGRNLIVSAAAGSGKTTVLVERFVCLITGAEPRADVDRILAVTFTDAAASQLKARIGNALRTKLQDKRDTRLERQLLLLDKASISTIHSFCLDVVRQNFHRFEKPALDPAFDVLDQNESPALQRDILERVFEEAYAVDEDGAFRDLVSRYGGYGLDESLKGIVLKIHSFLQTIPDQEAWVRQQCELEAREARDGTRQVSWQDAFMRYLKTQVDDLLLALDDAERLLPQGDETAALRGYVSAFRQAARDWSERTDGNPDGILMAIREFDPGRRPPARKDWGGWVADWDRAIKLVQDAVKDLRGEVAFRSWSDYEEEIARVAPFAGRILSLACRFEAAYAQAKASLAILDFNDLEHKCLWLLTDRETDGPSELALSLRDRFQHVLVDEYQDTNRVQDRILSLIARPAEGEDPPNLFVVGDVKQSIYRFRQAEPRVFQNRYDRSSDSEDSTDMKIDLSTNFRSRRGIVDAVNAVFERLLTGGESEITYDEGARLIFGAKYDEEAPSGPTVRDPLPVEVHLLPRDVSPDEPSGEDEEDDVEEWEKDEREAYFVAERIDSLFKERMQVWDSEEGSYRELKHRDIVILLRAPSGKAGTYSDALSARKIPVFAEPSTGYFTSTEIQDFLSLLRVIDNPLQDIPLAAVLRSPLVGLDEEDLVRIRLADRKAEFYRALAAYSESADRAELRQQVTAFLKDLDRWRSMARRGPLADLVWALYSETDYPAYVMGLDNGAQRRANLIDLHDRARQFDRFRTQGLRRFLAFIDRLLENEGDIGQAPALAEAEDTVRILSVHKSKGLEFPVVFLPDLAKGFNEEDLKPDVLFDRELGIACSVVDPDRRIRYPSLPRTMVREKIRARNLAEELRVLYVAMTRAREHLILSATVDLDKMPARWALQTGNYSQVFKRARSMVDWLGPVLAGMPEWVAVSGDETAAESQRFSIRTYTAEEVLKWPVRSRKTQPAGILKTVSALEPLGVPVEEEDLQKVMDRVEWEYAHVRATGTRGKESVTGLKRRLNAWEGDTERDPYWIRAFDRCPDFDRRDACVLGAREIGLATHAVMEHLDLSETLDEESIRRQMAEMVERRILSPEEGEGVSVDGIMAWFGSDLGRRMLENRATLRKELPFTLRMPARLVYPDWEEKDGEEGVVVQGIIDALFEEEDEYVIVDYKTDNIPEDGVEARAKDYEFQMQAYARAVERILKKPVRAAYLYFMLPGKSWKVNL
jgi:ATP-dependent helicase/nuclease subunit A